MNNSNQSISNADLPQSGYDLPIAGIDNGWFHAYHIAAIVCMVFSLSSVIAVIVISFRLRDFRTFFKWTKSERFAVYLAAGDGLFNITHMTDHTITLITRSHIYPPQLCQFFGFMLAEFTSSQVLMVNLIAINVFALVAREKDLTFGRGDWRLLTYTFGLPFIGGVVAAIMDQFGSNGLTCYFDGVRGRIANFFFSTVPLFIVLIVNGVLYLLSFWKICQESRRSREILGNSSTVGKSTLRVARNMALFVAAFFVQWFPLALISIWVLAGSQPPPFLILLTTTLPNSGGVFNGIVFYILRKRKLSEKETGHSTSPNHTNVSQ